MEMEILIGGNGVIMIQFDKLSAPEAVRLASGVISLTHKLSLEARATVDIFSCPMGIPSGDCKD